MSVESFYDDQTTSKRYKATSFFLSYLQIISDSYYAEFVSMRKAFYMNIPLALIGGIFFLHASLNLLFDRDRLKKNAEKRQESIEFATYSNAAVS